MPAGRRHVFIRLFNPDPAAIFVMAVMVVPPVRVTPVIAIPVITAAILIADMQRQTGNIHTQFYPSVGNQRER